MLKHILISVLGVVIAASAQPFLSPEDHFFGIPDVDSISAPWLLAMTDSTYGGFAHPGDVDVLPGEQISAPSEAHEFRLEIQSSTITTSECLDHLPPSEYAYLLGGIGELVVLVVQTDSARLPYDGVHDWTWPQGLVIEAAVSNTPVSSDFVPSDAVTERLNLRYFVFSEQAHVDMLWHRGHQVPVNHPDNQIQFWFQFDIASEWVGSYLCFRVHYAHPMYGDLLSPVACKRIVAPCSHEDTLRIGWNHIKAYADARDYDRAFAYADSLLAAGWIYRSALNDLQSYAHILRRVDLQLRYLDAEFEHYGNICWDCGEDVRPITPISRAKYHEKRQQIMERAAAEQQQQEQH
jgi:hypothetical protein